MRLKLKIFFNNSFLSLKLFLISIFVVSFFWTLKVKNDDFFLLSLLFKDLSHKFAYLTNVRPKIGNEVVLILVDAKTDTELNMRFPFPRRVFAKCLEKVLVHKPKLIALDLTFVGETEKDDDMALLNQIKKSELVLFTYIQENLTLFQVPKMFKEAADNIGII
ncbi:hypothetical protein BVX93_00610, partial [bacterium B13(2017)]